MHNTAPPLSNQRDPAPSATETHQRFRRLRVLIHDPLRRHRLIILLSLLCLMIVSVMGWLTTSLPALPFDLSTTRELQEITSSPFQRLMLTISLFGWTPWSGIVVATSTLIVGVLLGWKDGAYLLLLTAVQGVTNQLIKTAIGRPRPLGTLVNVIVVEPSYSFPSGHVMFYTVFFGFLCFLSWTRLPRSLWRVTAIILTGGMVILIGPSRIYLGAHWLSGVIAAQLLGLIILAFGIEGYLRYLAPAMPDQQSGLVAVRDQSREYKE
jgi:membrane-associated phospholipid phosphatase